MALDLKHGAIAPTHTGISRDARWRYAASIAAGKTSTALPSPHKALSILTGAH